jgi:hypothetical protein
VTVAVVVVVVTGVTVAAYLANRDTWAGKGQPVAASALAGTPGPTWKPPNSPTHPDPVLQIRYELESRVLTSARVARPTHSACDRSDFTGAQPATFTCTVTYDTLKVVYRVSARPGNNKLVEYSATSENTVVTREGLLAVVWRQLGPSGMKLLDLRCEEFPAVALASVHEPLPQVCYGKRGADGRTNKITITPSDTTAPFLQVVPPR